MVMRLLRRCRQLTLTGFCADFVVEHRQEVRVWNGRRIQGLPRTSTPPGWFVVAEQRGSQHRSRANGDGSASRTTVQSDPSGDYRCVRRLEPVSQLSFAKSAILAALMAFEAALDAGNPHEAANGVAGEAEIVFDRDLS